MRLHPASARLLAATLAVAAGVQGAAAQEPDSLRVRTRGVADTITVLKPVQVDAQRSVSPERTTATAVRLDRSKLVRFQPATTGDALQAAPGLDIVKTGAWDSRVSVRGLSGERVLVMVDGVRLQTGRGHGAQTSLVSVDQLESFELLPGGGSAQFGSDALGAVVNLVTHRSLFASDPTATLSLVGRVTDPGDGGSAHARLRVLHPRWGAELGVGGDRLREVVTPYGAVPQSGHHELDVNGRGALQWRALTADYEHTRHAAFDIGLPGFATAAGGSAEYPLQSRDADRLELSTPESGWRPEFRLLAVQQRFLTRYDEISVDSLFVRRVLRGFQSNDAADRITTWSRSLQPSLRRGPLRVFGEYRYETTGGSRVTTNVTTNTSGATTATSVRTGESMPPARRTVLAAGATLGGRLRSVRWETGARWDHQHAVADSTPMSFTSALDVTNQRPSVDGGLSRAFGPVEPYVHAGTGFRAPNLEERYFNDDVHGGMHVFGNPDLVAERSFTSEGGLRFGEMLGGHVQSARVSVYRSDVDDMISIQYVDMLYGVPRFQYRNVRRARLEGAELQADVRLGGLQVVASGSLPRGRDVATGARLNDVGSGHVTMDFRVPVRRVLPNGTITLRARWNDATFAEKEQDLAGPAFWLGSAEATCVVGGTRIAFAVRNLTNESYREHLSFVLEPGRTWSLAMRRDLTPPWFVSHKE